MNVFEIIAALKARNTAIISDEIANNRNHWANIGAAHGISGSDMAVLVFGLDHISTARREVAEGEDRSEPDMINGVYIAEFDRLSAAL